MAKTKKSPANKKPQKHPNTIRIISEAIEILESIGLPLNDLSARRKEKMAMAFMAVAGVSTNWKAAKSLKDNRKVTTRGIITYNNLNFEEAMSLGSYDDIRRDDLKKLVLTDLVLNSGDNPSANANDPTRGYSLDNDFKELILTYGTTKWEDKLSKFRALKGNLVDKLVKPREISKQPVRLPNGITLELSSSYHNTLQKAIVEEFLSYYGQDCEVLYVGDTNNRTAIHEEETLNQLNFFSIGSGKLPDVIAYSQSKNWLFLIEAVTSSGPMDDNRVAEIRKLCKECKADLVFVTAFLTRSDFKDFASKIAWETEVWIADNPHHMIHFNGDKFLGPFVGAKN